MNRDTLDEFFARADDVLADWHGSGDAMTYWAGDEARHEDREPFDGDALRRATAAMTAFGVTMAEASRRLGEAMRSLGVAAAKIRLLSETAQTDPRERALRLRQNRNTGPAPRLGLDGHHRRP